MSLPVCLPWESWRAFAAWLGGSLPSPTADAQYRAVADYLINVTASPVYLRYPLEVIGEEDEPLYGLIEWRSRGMATANDNAGHTPQHRHYLRGEPLRRAVALLRECLTVHGGEAPASLVLQRAVDMGINLKTLQRAKERIGVIVRKSATYHGGWLWALPELP